jgi:hypothetical protein
MVVAVIIAASVSATAREEHSGGNQATGKEDGFVHKYQVSAAV